MIANKCGKPAWIAAIAVSILTFMIYLPALQNGFVDWDDNVYILDNSNIQSISLKVLKWIFSPEANPTWHPLTLLSFVVDYSIWGLNPFGYHLTNVILHTLNAFLVFILTLRLVGIKSSEKADNILIAAVTALLFGIHPLHVESVAWVSERKDVLCAFFFLLTILAYLRYITTDIKRKKVIYYILCLALFILSLMSKPMAVSLPLVLLIIDIYPLERFEKGLRMTPVFAEKVPFLILSLIASLIAVYSQELGEALRTIEKYPLVPRLFVAMYSYIFYLKKMLFPYNLAPFYPYPENTEVFTFPYIGSGILLAVIIFFCVRVYKRHKVFFATWIYYVITLLPVIGIIKVGSFSAADRYTYLPSLGPFLLAGIGIGYVFRIVSRRQFKILIAVVLIILGFLVEKTIRQISVWHDSITLGSHQIKLYPDSTVGYLIRGNAFNRLGNFHQAVLDLTKIIELDPEYADVYNIRGIVYERLGNYKQAIADHTKALELNPNNADLYFNRGVAYESSWNSQEALADYSMATKLNPTYAEAYYNSGMVYRRLSNYQQAITEFSRAIRFKYHYTKAYYSRGEAYLSVGDFQSAINDFSKVVEFDPKNAMANYGLGVVYSRIGNRERSRVYYKKAADLGFK